MASTATVTCKDNQSGYLLDHNAGEVAVLKGSVDRVPSSQICSQLHVEFVEFVHLLQCQLHLASPVCGHKSGRRREKGRGGKGVGREGGIKMERGKGR